MLCIRINTKLKDWVWAILRHVRVGLTSGLWNFLMPPWRLCIFSQRFLKLLNEQAYILGVELILAALYQTYHQTNSLWRYRCQAGDWNSQRRYLQLLFFLRGARFGSDLLRKPCLWDWRVVCTYDTKCSQACQYCQAPSQHSPTSPR